MKNIKKMQEAFNPLFLSVNELSPKQRLVAYYLAKGHKTNEIAELLSLKSNTVSTVKKIVLSKLNVANQFELFQKYKKRQWR